MDIRALGEAPQGEFGKTRAQEIDEGAFLYNEHNVETDSNYFGVLL